MVLQKLWNQVDPKDSKILALITNLETLESACSTSFSSTPKNGNNKGNGGWEPDKWQITYTGPTFTDPKTRKLLHWCELHKGQQDQWPGMYINHLPGEHENWQAKKTERKAHEKAAKAAKAAAKSGTTPAPQKLTLSEKK